MRVAHFVIFEKLVFTIASKISRISIDYIEPKDSRDSKLQIDVSLPNGNFDIFKLSRNRIFQKSENSQP